MVKCNPSGKVGQDGMAIFVNGEKEVPLRRKGDSCYIAAMCEREGVGLVAKAISSQLEDKQWANLLD